MDDDAQKLQVRHVGRDGRRRYDPASRDQLVAACLEPSVSASRLALEHGINANLVRKWVKRAREERALPAVSAFVPVQIAPDMHSSAANGRLTKAELIGKRSHASMVSALLPNGVSLTVECSDVDGLAAIIGALGRKIPIRMRLGGGGGTKGGRSPTGVTPPPRRNFSASHDRGWPGSVGDFLRIGGHSCRNASVRTGFDSI